MSITEIKNIKKLQEMLRSALDEIEYLKECCTKAGEELAKYIFPYDYKEKNLVIQAMELNEKFERREQALEEIERQSKINCEEICGKNYDTCNDKDCLTKQIIDIISKAKDGK